MLSGRLRNSLRFIMVLGFWGGFVGSTFKGILSSFEFCRHEIVPVTWNLKYLPPSPSSGARAGVQKQKHLPSLGTEIFVCTQCTNSAKLFLVVLSTSMAALSTSLSFYFKGLFSQGNWNGVDVHSTEDSSVSSPHITAFLPGSMFLMDLVYGPSPK